MADGHHGDDAKAGELGEEVGAYRIPNVYIRSTKVRNGPLPRFVMWTLTIVDNRQCLKLV